MKLRAMSISELNGYIKRTLSFDPVLSNTLVIGEMSNFKRHSSGHLYFTLKDDKSKINCVMFRSDAMKLDYQPKDGEKTEVRGSVSVYERDGKYQLYVHSMAIVGEGELYKAFIKMKKDLEQSGYFNKQNPIPTFPRKVGIISSKTSAALRDILKVMRRRNPLVEIDIFSVHVQGDLAPREIQRAFEYFNDESDVDTIILSRGGGSLEELWSFNTLEVAEAIYHSSIPVISGVGHETDFTISDFVADKRAATPSEAGELVTQSLDGLKEDVSYKFDRIYRSMIMKLNVNQTSIEQTNINRLCQLVLRKIETEVTNIDSTFDIIHNSIVDTLKEGKTSLQLLGKQLNALSPLNTLDRGYVIATKGGNKINSLDDVSVNDSIDITVKNGIIKTEVISKERKHFDGE